jgi:chemotaxis protein methyltransferase WspC
MGAFTSVDVDGAFAFRRVEAGAARSIPLVRTVVGRSTPSCDATATPSHAATPRKQTLADVERVADEGRLEEAHARIMGLLQSDPVCVDGWWLAGSIALAQEQPVEAERCFNKVVYLDPMHRLALLQLSALAERRHDAAQADRYRMRVSRTQGADRGG